LDDTSAERINIDRTVIKDNLAKLLKSQDFGDKLIEALKIMQPKKQTGLVISEQEVDGLLYDGFVDDTDKTKMRAVRAAGTGDIANLNVDFSDERLKKLLPLYKARNFPKNLDSEEQDKWEEFKKHRLLDGGESSRAARYFKRIEDLGADASENSKNRFLLEELNLYGQSILPAA
jgi:exodeoxyribonuclease-1